MTLSDIQGYGPIVSLLKYPTIFTRATLYASAGINRRRVSVSLSVCLTVCLSVCHTPVGLLCQNG